MTRVRLEPRGDRAAPLVFKQGAHPPYAIRWYGATSLFGHFRNLVATAIASESVDSRDWMRPLDAGHMLANVARVLGLEARGTLLASLAEPLWLDWVADTGDDRDVSQAVGRMVFSEYDVVEDGAPMTLPRGEVLFFGGDTAYPVATAEEIFKRVIQPWNEVLHEIVEPERTRPRVLLGIPGNHDWYDGLDGFGRMFRRTRGAERGQHDAAHPDMPRRTRRKRTVGLVVHGLHLDEVTGTMKMIADAAKTIRAFFQGSKVARRRRLVLQGYEAVQESSYWALPLADGLDLWGVDRQLGRLDYRQREYFRDRRRAAGDTTSIFFAAPDPARAFGEEWEPGERMLAACKLSLARDRVLYMCGDLHHYERRAIGDSLHVIAGGGGAFLHGTRITPEKRPAQRAYPDAATTRALVAQVPFRLMVGRAGYLVHIALAFVASIELGAGWHNRQRFEWTTVAMTLGLIAALYGIAGHKRAHPLRVLAVAVPFGLALGFLPFGLAIDLPHIVPLFERDTAAIIVYAFVGAFLFGLFLALCAIVGLESEQSFTVLGHPGFKHFVRLRISPDGTVDAWTIGKDDPLATDGPYLIDRWTWHAQAPAKPSVNRAKSAASV